jgi:general secretion pathway protein G
VNAFTVDNNGRYPDSLERLVEKDENGLSYLDRDNVPLDPWGNEYQYEPPGSGSASFRVFTLGADGTQGGDGKDRDFSNIDIKNGDI